MPETQSHQDTLSLEEDIERILAELELATDTFPDKAIRAAVENQEAITPALLNILEAVIAHPDQVEDSSLTHIYALHLLAQFREQRAYPLIIRLCSLPQVNDLLEETLTEGIAQMLAAVCQGDIKPIMSLIENEDADEFARSACLDALKCLVSWGEKSREELMAYFQSLFREKLQRVPSFVWNALVICCMQFYPEEVFEDIRQTYQEKLVHPIFMGEFSEVERIMALGKEKVFSNLQNVCAEPITDTVSEMHWWACFQPEEKKNLPLIPEMPIFTENASSPTQKKHKQKKTRNLQKASRKKNRKR